MKTETQKNQNPIIRILQTEPDENHTELRSFFRQGLKDGYKYGISQINDSEPVSTATVCNEEHLLSLLTHITSPANVYPLEMFNGPSINSQNSEI